MPAGREASFTIPLRMVALQFTMDHPSGFIQPVSSQHEIDSLIKDIDKDGQKKISDYIRSVLHLYNLNFQQVKISRKKIKPTNIGVAFVEESRLDEARWLAGNKYKDKTPWPIILIQYKNKKVIFAGSNRSLVFLLKNKNPDCIIIELPKSLAEPKIVKEAKLTLKDIFQKGI